MADRKPCGCRKSGKVAIPPARPVVRRGRAEQVASLRIRQKATTPAKTRKK